MGYDFDFSVVWQAWPLLLKGTFAALYYATISSDQYASRAGTGCDATNGEKL
jgi:hypothetical protein